MPAWRFIRLESARDNIIRSATLRIRWPVRNSTAYDVSFERKRFFDLSAISQRAHPIGNVWTSVECFTKDSPARRETRRKSGSFYGTHSCYDAHPQYRTENAGALLGDWPRIPIPATADLLTRCATLGLRLAALLDPESDLQLKAEWSFLARLFIPPEFPEGTRERDTRNSARFALTASWGAAQGGTVMPRHGDVRERGWTDTELGWLRALAATQSNTLESALDLLGPSCVDVYLNSDACWYGVPFNVWEYTLGGYQVLKKWLSYREASLLGRPLREEEARYFAQVVRRITAVILLGPALDASYAAIVPDATGRPT